MAIVHDPRTPITASVPLADTASGSWNIYALGDVAGPTAGRKIDSSSIGAPVSEYWSADDANLLGHLLVDIVNTGTVPLFIASSSQGLRIDELFVSGTKWDAASGTLNLVSSSYVATSQSVGAWTKSGVFTGPFAASFSSSYSVSGTLVLLSSTISSNYGTTLNNGLRIGNLEGAATATAISSTLWGEGFLPWVNGVSGALSALSTSFYESDLVDNLVVSGALKQIAMEFLGTPNLLLVFSGTGGATGSHPTGTFNNLREAFYALTASFNSLSSTVSSSVLSGSGASGSITALSGVVYPMSSAFYPLSESFYSLSGGLSASASYWNEAAAHVFSASVDVAFLNPSGPTTSVNTILFSGSNLIGSYAGVTATIAFEAPSTATFNALTASFNSLSGNLNLSASRWNSVSSSYSTLSGNLNNSASIWNANTTGALSTSLYTLSGNLDLSASRWNSVSSSVSGILNSGSFTTIATAFYLRSANDTVWRITIDNAGILSSSVA